MRRFVLVAVLPVVALVAPGTSTPTSGQQPSLASLARRSPDYRSEQEWLVQEVVGTIAYQAWAARGSAPALMRITVRTRPASAEQLLERALIDVTVSDRLSTSIDISTHLWAPDAYVAVAQQLLGPATRVRPPAATDRGSTARALVTPLVGTFTSEDDRVSGALGRNRLDPSAHEDAALLVAALALRERAGRYSDPRRLLSRVTAHLAVATALAPQGQLGESGRLASLIVSLLVGREDLFEAGVAAWPEPGRSPAAAAWLRALRLRATGDWRSVEVARPTTLLERLEYARALKDRLGDSRLLGFYDTQFPPDDDPVGTGEESATDWHRIALEGPWSSFGIETGHRFATEAADLEVSEATEVWRHYHQGTPAQADVIAALNDDPREDGHVLGWSTWAPALQRHLAASLASSARFLRFLGASKDLDAWPSAAEPRFGGLQLYPFVLRQAASTPEQYQRAMRLAERIQVARPELVTAAVSALLRERPPFDAPIERVPDDTAWLTPHEPTGTGFDLHFRTLSEGCPRPVPMRHVERWAAWAPHASHVRYGLVWLRAPGQPAFGDLQRELGPLLEYDLVAADRLIRDVRGTPEQNIAVSRAMCRIEPDTCDGLFHALLMDGREEEAATVGDSYAREARDTVALSHSTGWLVKYLWDTDRRTRAAEIAATVGRTGSAPGLETAGLVMERQGRLDEAEAAFTKISEHYDDPTALTAFCLRRAAETGADHWLERAKRVGERIFPKGLEAADPAWLPAPPTDGMLVVTCGRRCARSGIRAGDVVAGLDGRRVRSLWQYMVLSRASADPRMRFVIWREAKYLTLDATVPQRWLAVQLADHPAAVMPSASSQPDTR